MWWYPSVLNFLFPTYRSHDDLIMISNMILKNYIFIIELSMISIWYHKIVSEWSHTLISQYEITYIGRIVYILFHSIITHSSFAIN